jgi:hypothetical protein
MQPWAIISAIVGILALIVTVFLQLNGSIDEKIEKKLKDPEFISKVADEVKLPFVIFDEDDSIIVDTGTMSIIDKISINKKDGRYISEIIITPKKYLAIAPILESLDPQIEFQDPIRGNKFDFIYKRLEGTVIWKNNYASTPPKSKFRLQVIILPKENIH